jgi:hypothetical protein
LPGRTEEHHKNSVRFEVLTASNMKIRVFWDITPCSLAGHQTDTLHGVTSQKALIFTENLSQDSQFMADI